MNTICAVVIQAESLNYCGVVWVCNSRSGDLENQWSDYYGMVRIQRCLEWTYLKKRLKSWRKVSGLCVTCEFLPVGISILRLSKFGSTNWNYISEAYIVLRLKIWRSCQVPEVILRSVLDSNDVRLIDILLLAFAVFWYHRSASVTYGVFKYLLFSQSKLSLKFSWFSSKN